MASLLQTVFFFLMLARFGSSSSSCFGKRCGAYRAGLRPAGRMVFNTPTGTLTGGRKNQMIIIPWSGVGHRTFSGFKGSGIGRVWSSSHPNNLCRPRADNIVNNRCFAAPPGPPSFIRVTDISSTNIVVHWGLPNQTNGYILRYEVTYRSTNMTEDDQQPILVDVNHQGYNNLELVLENLDQDSEYEIAIAAVNFICRGEEATISVTTSVEELLSTMMMYSEAITGFPTKFALPHTLLAVIAGAILLIIFSAVLFMVAFCRKRRGKKDRNVHPSQQQDNNRRGQLPELPTERYKVFYGNKIETGVETKEPTAEVRHDDFYSFCIESRNDSLCKGTAIAEPFNKSTKSRGGDLSKVSFQFDGLAGYAGKLPDKKTVSEEDFGEVYDETEVDMIGKKLSQKESDKATTKEKEKGNLKQCYKESWKFKSTGHKTKGNEVKGDSSEGIKNSKKKNNKTSIKKHGVLSLKKSGSTKSCDFGEFYDDTSLGTQPDEDAGEIYDETELDDQGIEFYGSSGELYEETDTKNDDFDDFYDETVPNKEANDLPKKSEVKPAKHIRFAAILSVGVSKVRKGMVKIVDKGKREGLTENGNDDDLIEEDIYDEPDFLNEATKHSKMPEVIPSHSRATIPPGKKNDTDYGGDYCYEVSKSELVDEGDDEELYEETGGVEEEIYETI